ncbi:MAG: hypothetical protein FJW98_02855 [Actinobacteria bacterium]|nr:hypothetical protein [Actinomycetota bacterium]
MSPKPTSRPSLDDRDDAELGHVVVAGGTPHEWLAFDAVQWRDRVDALAAGVARAGTRWLTLYPFGGESLSLSETRNMDESLSSLGKIKNIGDGQHPRWVLEADDGLSICIEPDPDGHNRFARVLNALRTKDSGEPLNDAAIATAVLAPSPREPDLVVILGPPTRLPTSLVWELAYSELVFLDLGWTNVSAADLELAVDDFTRRNRRFGGLDS